MTDDSDIRRANLIDDHLGAIYGMFNWEKAERQGLTPAEDDGEGDHKSRHSPEILPR